MIGRVACIGVGAMGGALVGGVVQAGLVAPHDVFVADVDAAKAQHVAQTYGVQPVTSREAASRADVIVVAVKPGDVPAALQELAAGLRPGACVISIAAGVPLSVIERWLPDGTPAIRAMPNTPCLVRQGAIALAAGTHAGAEHVEKARELFGAVGLVATVPEPLLDAVTGLSGSGPAYVYMFIEALADGGVLAGLPRDVAMKLAAQTVLGAAHMVLESGRHPGQLKDMVTSPAGTTIAGVKALEEHAFRAACMRAVEAAAKRSRELGRTT